MNAGITASMGVKNKSHDKDACGPLLLSLYTGLRKQSALVFLTYLPAVSFIPMAVHL